MSFPAECWNLRYRSEINSCVQQSFRRNSCSATLACNSTRRSLATAQCNVNSTVLDPSRFQVRKDQLDSSKIEMNCADASPQAWSSRFAVYSFLELGICREQIFTEVSLGKELAEEARFVENQLLRHTETQQLRLTPRAEPIDSSTCHSRIGADNSDHVSERGKFTEGGGSRRRESQRTCSSASRRRLKGKPEVGVREMDRRKGRQRRWHHHVAAAAATLTAEPGAVEQAMKRYLRSYRPGTARQKQARDAGLQAQLQLSHNTTPSSLDSALDILYGARLPLLTREQEVQLINDMKSGLRIQSSFEELESKCVAEPACLASSLGSLTRKLGMSLEEMVESLRLGLQAKHALMHANKRLVFKLAHKFGFDKSVPFEDYVMAGMDGLVTGLLKFDPARGHKLSSLLVWWIRSSVSKLATELNKIVCAPRRIQYDVLKLQRAGRQMSSELGRAPSEQELATRLQLSAQHLRDVQAVAQRVVLHLEDPARGQSSDVASTSARKETTQIGDLLVASDQPSAKASLREVMVRECLDTLLCSAKPRDAEIMRALYGMHPGASHTSKLQNTVAREWGLCAKRISQIRRQVIDNFADQHHDLLMDALALDKQD